MGRISSLTSSSTVRPRRGCAVCASVLNAASSAAVVAGESRPSLLAPCPAAEASEGDRSVGPAALLGAGDATGSLGESSCIAGIAPSGCGVEAARGMGAAAGDAGDRISRFWFVTRLETEPALCRDPLQFVHDLPQASLDIMSRID